MNLIYKIDNDLQNEKEKKYHLFCFINKNLFKDQRQISIACGDIISDLIVAFN